jgi:ribosomal protein L7/L12
MSARGDVAKMGAEDRQDPGGLTLPIHHGESAMAGSTGNGETRYDITLVSAGTKPKRVAWTLASITGLRRREAWGLLAKAPVLILRDASYATAEGAREALERRGATVEMRAHDVVVPKPEPSPVAPAGPGGMLLLAIVIIFVFALLFLASAFPSCPDFCGGHCLP